MGLNSGYPCSAGGNLFFYQGIKEIWFWSRKISTSGIPTAFVLAVKRFGKRVDGGGK